MAWYLNPALTRFREEVNARWPNRDKRSDGTIGDEAHQLSSSDHNPDPDGSVDAWDMDVDGVDVNACIAAALKHEAIQYVIYNRRITSRSWGLGTWRTYDGASPHTEHVHFNTRTAYENSTKPWFPKEGWLMALTDKEQAELLKNSRAATGFIGALFGNADGVTQTWSDVDKTKVLSNELKKALDALPPAVVERLAGQDDATVAAALKAALGDRAAAVGALLQS